MLTTAIAKAAVPNLGWTGSEPGLLAILAEAFRRPSAKAVRGPDDSPGTGRFAKPQPKPQSKPQPVPFAWL